MGVRSSEHEPFARQASPAFYLVGDGLRQFAREPEQVARDKHERLAGSILQGKRFDVQIVQLSFRGMVAVGVTRHPHGAIGSDHFGSDAGTKTSFGALRTGGWKTGSRERH